MYGISLLTVSKVLGSALLNGVLNSQDNCITLIHHQIVKYAAEQNIQMVKSLMNSIARQNAKAYQDVIRLLREHFSEKELEDILF